MLADRASGRTDQGLSQLSADLVAAVVAQPGQARDRHALEGLGGGVVLEEGSGQFAIQPLNVTGELRKAEVDQTVELADAIAEVLDQAIPKPDELAQLLGGRVGQAGGRGTLLGAEAGQPARIDSIRLGARQVLPGQAMRAPGGEQGPWNAPGR